MADKNVEVALICQETLAGYLLCTKMIFAFLQKALFQNPPSVQLETEKVKKDVTSVLYFTVLYV